MSRFLSARFAGMEAYVPGEQPQNRSYNKLNTNENPFPPCPGVLAAINGGEAGRLHLYSDPDTRQTSKAIGDHFGLEPKNVLLGNGSDELLSFCFQAFCDEKNRPCFPNISYGFYQVFARAQCLEPIIVPVDEELMIRPEDYHHMGGTVILANPNAPTGQSLSRHQIGEICRTNPTHVVVVDEAYVDFGGESSVPLIGTFDNLLVIQTMSKSRCLAGARLGFALGHESLIADLTAMKFSFNPYNVNRLTLLAGEAAIRDEAYFKKCTDAVIKNRAYTRRELTKRGFTVGESKANFLFVKPNFIPGRAYYLGLKEKGILVRHFDNPLIQDYVRISIGTEEQMELLLKGTDELMELVGGKKA